MPKKEKTPQRRTTIKNLPGKEKELSKEEQKKVKGGTPAGSSATVDLYSKPKQ